MTSFQDKDTPEELIELLREAVTGGFYFEICSESAKVLLDYIEKLEAK